MSGVLSTIEARLRAALERLEEGGAPHVIEVHTETGRLRLQTVAGAVFEVWEAPELPIALPTVERAALARIDRWRDEPFDVYRVDAEGVAAVEVRSLAGESVLEVVVQTPSGPLRARVLQQDALRWAAEEDARIGDGFQDFAERNALWPGLGGARPRGWRLDVVEPGEDWPPGLQEGS